MMNILPLNCEETKISAVTEPKEVLLLLRGYDEKKTRSKPKPGTRVKTGEQIMPGVFSTVTGTIKSIEPLLTAAGSRTALRIEVAEEEEFDPALKGEANFLEMEPQKVLEKLNRANLGFCEELGQVDTVIVSAVDAGPLAAVCQQILRENSDKVSEGLTLVQHLTSAKKVVLAVPEPLYDFSVAAAGNGFDIYRVKPIYPNGVPETLLRDMADHYHLDSHLFLSVEKLVAALAALKQGTPFLYKTLSLADQEGIKNFRVRIGTLIKDLLKDHDLKNIDKIIVGGPLRGYTCFNMEVPITAEVDSIYLQAADEVVYYRNNQCMSCGRCVRVCPVNLDVNLLCRYAEFSLFETCLEMGVMTCIECGLCAFNCPSGRSLVQLIGLAKKEAGKNEKQEGEEES